MSVAEKALWLPRQLRGWGANLWDVVTTTRLGDVLPPSIVGLILFIRDSVPRSLGFTDSLMRHVTGVVVLVVFMVLASLGVLTIVALFYGVIFGSLALLRLFPAVNSRWPLSESDWPLWDTNDTWV